MSFRYMRMILFFDLPRYTSKDRKQANDFVKNLKREGFIMLQESVYCKLLLNEVSTDLVKTRIESIKPKQGSIMLLTVTEKQFNNIDFILGEFITNKLNSVDRFVVL